MTFDRKASQKIANIMDYIIAEKDRDMNTMQVSMTFIDAREEAACIMSRCYQQSINYWEA
jgi:hypothetical protein